MLSAVLQVHLFALFLAFLFSCNRWAEEGKAKASEDVLKGQTVQVEDLVKWACYQQLFKWWLLVFWGQVLHTLSSAQSTHDVYTRTERWIQPLLPQASWLEPAAPEVTAVRSEGLALLMTAKLCTKTEECSTPDLSGLPLLVLGSLLHVSGLSHAPLVERLPMCKPQCQCFAWCRPSIS